MRSILIISNISCREWLNYIVAFVGSIATPMFATFMLLAIIYGLGKDKKEDD